MKPKLLLAEPQDFSAEVIQQLKKYFSVDIKDDLDQNGFEDSFYLYDIIWFRFKYDLLNFKNTKSLKCKTLVCPVTGPNHIDELFLKQNDIGWEEVSDSEARTKVTNAFRSIRKIARRKNN